MSIKNKAILILLTVSFCNKIVPVLHTIDSKHLQNCFEALKNKPVREENLLRMGQRGLLISSIFVKRIDKNCFAWCNKWNEIQVIFVKKNKQLIEPVHSKYEKILFDCSANKPDNTEHVVFEMKDSTQQGYWEFVRQK